MRRTSYTLLRQLPGVSFFHQLPTVAAVEQKPIVEDSQTAREALHTLRLGNWELKQTQAIDELDHKGFEVSHPAGVIQSGQNALMHVKKPHQSGFGEVESHLAYVKRVIKQAYKTADYLQKNPQAISHFQEFAIEPQHVRRFIEILRRKGVTHRLERTRTQGVATFLPENSPFHLNDELMKQINNDPALMGRFLVFNSSDSCYMINGHIPFNGTEAAFKKISTLILKHAARVLGYGVENIVITVMADTNLSPSAQKTLADQAYWDFVTTRDASEQPFEATSYLLPSPNGHLMMNPDGTQKLVTVDSFWQLVFSPSQEYRFHHATESEAKSRYKHFMGFLVGGGVVAATVAAEDFTTEAALEVILATAGKERIMAGAGLFAEAARDTLRKTVPLEHPLVKMAERSFGFGA